MTRRAKNFLARCIACVMLCALISSFLPSVAYATEVEVNKEASLEFVMKFVNNEDTVLKVGQKFKDEGVVIEDATGKTWFSIRYENGESVVRDGNNKIVKPEDDLRVVGDVDTSKEGENVLTYKCGGYSLKRKIPVLENVNGYKAEENMATAKEVKMTFSANLCGAENFVKLVGEEFVDPGISVSDRNGRRYRSFESLFKVSGKVNVDKQGEYKIKYAFGENIFRRTVDYVNSQQCIEISLFMALLGDKEEYLQPGDTYEDSGAALMDENGNILYSWARDNNGNVIVKDASGNLLTCPEGEFGITSSLVRRNDEIVVTEVYQFAGASVSRSIHISSTVNRDEAEEGEVQELSFIFALLGNKKVKLNQGEQFVEPGYSVFGFDGSVYASLIQSVSVTGEIMSNKTGEYELKYTLVNTLSRFVSIAEETIITEVDQDTTDDSVSWTPPSIPTPTPPDPVDPPDPVEPTHPVEPTPPDEVGDGTQKPAEPSDPVEPTPPVAPPDNIGEGNQKPAVPGDATQKEPPALPPSEIGDGTHPPAV